MPRKLLCCLIPAVALVACLWQSLHSEEKASPQNTVAGSNSQDAASPANAKSAAAETPDTNDMNRVWQGFQ